MVGFSKALVKGNGHLADTVVPLLVVGHHDDGLVPGEADVVLELAKPFRRDLLDVGVSVVERPLSEDLGVGAADGDHLLDVLEEEGLIVLGAHGSVVHRNIVEHGLIFHGHAELVAHVPQGNVGGVDGGVADLEAVAVDVSGLVIVIGDAVGVVAEGALGAAVGLLVGAAQAVALGGSGDDVQIAVHEEVDGILVELAAGHVGVFQHAVLLAVKGGLTEASLLGHDEGVDALIVEPLADLGIDGVARGKGLAVTAVAVGTRLLDIGHGITDEPLLELLVAPVEGGIAPGLAAVPVGMLLNERRGVHGAPGDDIQQDVHALGVGVVHELFQLVPARLLILGARQPRLDAVEADIAVAVPARAPLVDGSQPQDVDARLGVEVDEVVGILEGTADGGGVDAQLHHDGGIQPRGGGQIPLFVGGGHNRLVPALVGEEGAVVDLVGRVGVGVVTRHVHQEIALGTGEMLGDKGLDGAGHGHLAARLDLNVTACLVHGQRPVEALPVGVGQGDDLPRGGFGHGGMCAELGIHDTGHVGKILGVLLLQIGGGHEGVVGLTLGNDG